MRVQTFEQMLLRFASEYLSDELDVKRKEMLEKYPFSVLVEGAYFETDGLEKWIEQNLGADQIRWYFYIKTGYDFGFTEFFFADRSHADRVNNIVPRIYIRFPDSQPPGRTYKTNGGDSILLTYQPQDLEAIVIEYLE